MVTPSNITNTKPPPTSVVADPAAAAVSDDIRLIFLGYVADPKGEI
jgi:hypothetical protein